MATLADVLWPANFRKEDAMRAAMTTPAPQVATGPNVFGAPRPTHMGQLDPAIASEGVPSSEFWKAWHPNAPYVGDQVQQEEIARLLAMQKQNVEGGVPAQPQQQQGFSLASLLTPAAARPQQAAPMEAAAAPMEQPQGPDPVSKWQQVLDNLKKPEVLGPMQTFFSALSAPLAPWESTGSRLGRATQLMQMHQGMLADSPRQREMQDLELRGKQAAVEGQEIDNAGSRLDNEGKPNRNRKWAADATAAESGARVATQTEPEQIEKARLEISKLEADGRYKEAQIKKQELENLIQGKYGMDMAQAELDKKRRDANEPYYQSAASKGKSLDDMPLDEVAATINSLTAAYRSTGAAFGVDGEPPENDYMAWIAATYGEKYAQEVNRAMAKLQAAGRGVVWKTSGGQPGTPAKKKYTLGADGKLK